MSRTKTILTPAEETFLRSIPAVSQALGLWSTIRSSSAESKQRRKEFALLLVEVNSRLSKRGSHEGLYRKWLIVNGIPRNWSYDLMAEVPNSGFKHRSKSKSAIRRNKVLAYLTAIGKADQPRRTVLFDDLCAYVRKAWNIKN